MAKDIYHDVAKRALQKDGWTITHDPFPIEIGNKSLYADLAAERLLGARKGLRKIVVEIKSFIGHSDVKDLQQAVGQYIMYLRILKKKGTDRLLYMAVTRKTFEAVFTIELGQVFLEDNFIRLVVFDDETEVITQWIPE